MSTLQSGRGSLLNLTFFFFLQMILPLRDVIAAQQSRAYRFGYSGMVLVVRGHEELFFELTDRDSRDTFRHLLEQQIDYARENAPTVRTPSALEEARRLEELQTPTALETSSSPPSEHGSVPAIMFQSTSSSFVDFKPKEQLHFVCLTIGWSSTPRKWKCAVTARLTCVPLSVRLSGRRSTLHRPLQRSHRGRSSLYHCESSRVSQMGRVAWNRLFRSWRRSSRAYAHLRRQWHVHCVFSKGRLVKGTKLSFVVVMVRNDRTNDLSGTTVSRLARRLAANVLASLPVGRRPHRESERHVRHPHR